ncbi:ERVV2 protein, partial [Ibidorhyncha struthersii]|nr:ERVV2 protein [Ibidorhyncha struthersii]
TAKDGGVCTIINSSCCAYVNKEKEVETDISQIWEKAKILHEVTQDNTSWGFGDLIEKLTSWLLNLAWLKQLLMIIITLLTLFFIICLMVKCAFKCCFNAENSYSKWKRNRLRQKLES